jgi:aspartate/glutamate racemase
MATIGFLHTSPVHVPTFEALVTELAPETASVAIVDVELLDRARSSGVDDPELLDRLRLALAELERQGAETIVCTCSTIGAVAEAIGHQQRVPIVRVDRPMAQRAVELGRRIVVVAALESTLDPTRALVESVAAEAGIESDLEVHLVAAAWKRFEAGDHEGYLTLIANELVEIAERCDVIVLAQASMAAAADRVEVGVPVLSSPRLAVSSLVDP